MLPNSFLARQYLQEQADRIAVERLFLTREEYHSRRTTALCQENELVELVAAVGYERQEIILERHHSVEIVSISTRLQQKNLVTQRKIQVESLVNLVATKRKQTDQLKAELASKKEQRRLKLRQVALDSGKILCGLDNELQVVTADLAERTVTVETPPQREVHDVITTSRELKAPIVQFTPSRRRMFVPCDVEDLTAESHRTLSRAHTLMGSLK